MARDVVMVNGLPGSGKSSLGPRLAEALGATLLSKDRVKDALVAAVDADVPAGLGAVAMKAHGDESRGAALINSLSLKWRLPGHARGRYQGT
jgi:cytidylate kinase